MRILYLLIIALTCMISSILPAITNDISNGLVRIKCNIMDSTQTMKETYFAGEPITYSLTIVNLGIYAIKYRTSSTNTALAVIDVVSYSDTLKSSSTASATKLDTISVLQPNDQVFVTNTVFIKKPGKYEFVVNPLFKFKKGTLPDIGNLNRIFFVQ